MAEAQSPIGGEEKSSTPSAAPAQSAAAETPSAAAPATEAVAPVTEAVAPAASLAPADVPTETPISDATVAAPDNADLSDEQRAIDELLKQATFEEPTAVAQDLPPTENLNLPNFSQIAKEVQTSSIDLLRDVDLNVKIELGRSQMLVEDVLKLGEGSVVELDKLAGDPVDVFVNERLVARGEVLVLNDNFCVRINEIVAGVKEEGL
ncbi:MAG TPA: flagellar motor switch protein FliN [Tepidisphaeraceae bacterium]|jgi:flagellar motor switch protein FliN/FliY